jgi:hypothetical protein
MPNLEVDEARRRARRANLTPEPLKYEAFEPPEVAVGQAVLYQDGLYSPDNPAHAAIVTEVGDRAVKLAILPPDLNAVRVVENDVRHKDDPDNPRLSAAAADGGEGFGVWWENPDQMSISEIRQLKELLALYAEELAPFGLRRSKRTDVSPEAGFRRTPMPVS